MKKTLALILALVMTMALIACGGTKTPAASGSSSSGLKVDAAGSGLNEEVKVDETKKYMKDLILGYSQKYSTLDPQDTSNGVQDTLYMLYHSTLVRYSYDTREILPELAKSWSSNDAGDQWTFVLRDDVTFHNGEKLTADDVVFTWERGVDGAASSATAKLIDKVVADNDYQVTFHLKQGSMDWLYNMADCRASVLNREAFAADPETGYKIGAGGWKVEKYELGVDITFTKYEDSWVWAETKTPTESLTFRTMTEDSARSIAVQTGEIQIGASPAVSELATLDKDPNVEYVMLTAETIYYLGFNCESEKLSDVNLRNAIAYATDPKEILDIVYEGQGDMAESFWGPTQLGLYTDYENPLEYNVEKAKEYLAKSNYPNGVELTITAASDKFAKVAEVLQAQLQDVGITCTVEKTDSPGLKQIIADNKLEILVYNKSCGAQGDQFRTILTYGNSTNRCKYNNARVMELLDLALAEKDEAKRVEMYKEIQELTHAEMPYRPLFYGVTTMLHDAGVSGVIWQPNTKHDFTYVICEERA